MGVRDHVFSDILSRSDIENKKVLDAGTDDIGCSHEFLAGLKPSKLISISIDKAIITQCEKKLSDEYRDFVEFISGDVTNLKNLFPNNYFDVIMADFLIAAVAGWCPFMEIDAIKELYRVLKPNGIIIFVGFEEPSYMTTTLTEKLILALNDFRDLTRILTGEKIYREFTLGWMLDRLGDFGFKITKVKKYYETYTLDFLDKQYNHIANILRKEQDEQLRIALLSKLRKMIEKGKEDEEFQEGYQCKDGGFMYAIKAMK
ncbi:MAG: class I SAM-dependent methyltransferase [Proteobacteria bacterium]|nr:class I SAM-dependent methyltransferase [Pseudomonadota bacterium]